jgi:hypothetical protein
MSGAAAAAAFHVLCLVQITAVGKNWQWLGTTLPPSPSSSPRAAV